MGLTYRSMLATLLRHCCSVITLWLGLCVLIAPAQAQTQPHNTCEPRLIAVEVAQAVGEPLSPPPEDGWHATTLPDKNWASRWPAYRGNAWYKLQWQNPNCDNHPLALHISSLGVAGAVFLNHSLLWRDANLSEPLSRSIGIPRYWVLPDALLKPGLNTIWIWVSGATTQFTGLQYIELGTLPTVLATQRASWWQNQALLLLNLGVTGVLGTLAFFIWLRRRNEQSYGLYALQGLLWVLYCSLQMRHETGPLFSDSLQLSRVNILLFFSFILSFALFVWSFGNYKHIKKLSIAAIALFGLATPVVLLASPTTAPLVLFAVFFIALIVFWGTCVLFPIRAWRNKQAEQRWLSLCLLAYLATSVYDTLTILGLSSSGHLYSAYTSLLTMLFMSALLSWRLVNTMRRIEQFNKELTHSVAEAREELRDTLARKHELALNNSRLQERLHIAQDLHDGLGSSLIRSMAMIEQQKTPLPNQQFLSILKLLRDDLRQLIDAGASAKLDVPELPSTWIAPLRYRFGNLFDSLDIKADWVIGPQWDPRPSPLQVLALTRLVEEALTNVVKHSHATHLNIILQQPDDHTLRLIIEDNGIGFDVDAVQTAGLSIGMRSMANRMQHIGATLHVQSRPGHTCLEVLLPLNAASAK
ncbi:7TM diverse intracellular signaling domain-containing protein [Paenalcaligenes sp. Me131]|uniref:sensor histidine kinase n=1 Tax=Paenalcaligenes sp. Me131 TaxID=3392636 RepID=UPI003D26DA33